MEAAGSILALVTSEDGSCQIVSVGLAGTSRAIVRLRSTVNGASLSPDGVWLVYSTRTDATEPQSDIFIMPAAGGAARILATGVSDDRFPIWSPDGTAVLFVSDRTGTTGLWRQAVRQGREAGAAQLLSQDLGRIVSSLVLTTAGAYMCFRETGLVDVYIVDLDSNGLPAGEPSNAGRGAWVRTSCPRGRLTA